MNLLYFPLVDRIIPSAVSVADPISVKWCYINDAGKKKCEDMKPALSAAAQALQQSVQVECVGGTDAEDCMAKIKKNEADLIDLEARDINIAGTVLYNIRQNKVKPFAVMFLCQN